jgi:O-antigen/teichoic acid export membrane protein
MNASSFVRTAATNAVLQGATMLGKAAMLLALARYLPVSEVGVFGLLFATINFAMYAVALDFSSFTMREILKTPAESVPHLLRTQLSLHGATYGVVLPLLLLLFAFGVLPWPLAPWFYALLVLEHLGQEVHRVLITLQRSSQAGLTLFIRQGAWGLVLAVLMTLVTSARNLDTVLVAWSVCEVVGLGAGVWLLRDLAWEGVFARRSDWVWARRGLRIALPFLLSTLAVTGMSTIDRYALSHYRDHAAVGVFTFFMFARSAIQGLTEVGVRLVLQPKIVLARQTGAHDQYTRLMTALFAGTLGGALVLSALAAVVIEPALGLIGRPEYGAELPAFWMVLALSIVATVADVPHAGLYARHLDRAIVVSGFLGLGTALVALLALVPRFGVLGAAAATTCGFATMGLARTWALYSAP